jgi:hypothetical protein
MYENGKKRFCDGKKDLRWMEGRKRKGEEIDEAKISGSLIIPWLFLIDA